MKHDVMKALSAARPGQLDPSADPAAAGARRERDLERALRAAPEAAPPAGRARGRRPVRWGAFGLGALAAGAAAAVAVAAIGSGSGSPATPGTPASVDLGKRAVLAAAENAEAQPTGEYWYSDIVSGRAAVVRAPTGAYAITVSHGESFSWHGAKSGMGSAYFQRDLPARPQTARDRELWRKAGSPASFRVPTDGGDVTFTTKAAPWRSEGPEAGHDAGGGGDFLDGKSAEDLRNLPTDPAELAAMFLSPEDEGAAAGLQPGARAKGPAFRRAVPHSKIMRVASLLMNNPLPPKVRAGLMRALAAQEGVRPIGRVTDPLGRPGVALAAADRATTITDGPEAGRGTWHSRPVIIFDERTGALLSRQEQLTRPGGEYAGMKPGFVVEHQTVRSATWTDGKPKPPAKLPH
ncbi:MULTISPECIES: CU044_5270 family protein [unclassified Spirillospora]|uniref:CU044_5270 family protein n=1 Tax=unclassified Spirillospora TaxID=2642701 RepID=UPI003717CAA4